MKRAKSRYKLFGNHDKKKQGKGFDLNRNQKRINLLFEKNINLFLFLPEYSWLIHQFKMPEHRLSFSGEASIRMLILILLHFGITAHYYVQRIIFYKTKMRQVHGNTCRTLYYLKK